MAIVPPDHGRIVIQGRIAIRPYGGHVSYFIVVGDDGNRPSGRGQHGMEVIPARKPNRLKGYDYSSAGYYFVTICTKDRREFLGQIIDGLSVLNNYGHIVKREIEKISAIRKECIIENYVVMPNHIHLIVRIVIVGDDGNRPSDNRPSEPRADCHPPLQRKSISNMVQGFKGAVTRQIGSSLWQRSFHDHIIRNEADFSRIWQYVDENPARWHEDCFYPKQQ